MAGAEDFRKGQLRQLYEESRRFFENFIWSRFPTTICWLLEILLLLSEKFLKQSKMDKKQRLEFCGILDRLLEKAGEIVSDKFGIRYTKHYGIDKISYSPTIYEMVKRFEFSRCKLLPEEDRLKEQTINENLTFQKFELDSMNAIPCMRGSMFEGKDFVQYNVESPGQHDTNKFMIALNSFIHSGGI